MPKQEFSRIHSNQLDLLPSPLYMLLVLCEGETQPLRKVYRLIDTFEWAIKWHTCLSVCDILQLANLTPQLKMTFAAGLRTPSLGIWFRFYRESLDALQNPSIPFKEWDRLLSIEKNHQIVAFRNLYGHGGTPDDEECSEHYEKYFPVLQQLLGSPIFTEIKLLVAGNVGNCILQGKATSAISSDEHQIPISHTAAILPSGDLLSLWPLCFFVQEKIRSKEERFFFFNAIKNKQIEKLNYEIPALQRDKELKTKFDLYFPLGEWSKSTDVELAEIRARIESLTERFKGRLQERRKLQPFCVSGEGVLMVYGEPGIGKSALLAQVLLEVEGRVDSEGNTIEEIPPKVIEYFIRRGSLTQKTTLFLSYLCKKMDALFRIRAMPIGQEEAEMWNNLHQRINIIDNMSSDASITLVIDGLDENPEFLSLVPAPRRWLRIVLASRPTNEIITWWDEWEREIHSKHLIKLGRLNDADVRAILLDVVDRYQDGFDENYVSAVTDRSQGNPLYLNLLCEIIFSENGKVGDLKKIPSNMESLYRRTIKRLTDGGRNEDSFNVLLLLSVARTPMSIATISEFLDCNTIRIETSVDEVRELLVQMEVNRGDSEFMLFHESLREWLQSSCKRECFKIEKRLVQACLSYQNLLENSARKYALEYLASHLCNLKDSNAVWSLIAESDFLDDQIKFLGKYSASLETLHICILYFLNEKDRDKNTLFVKLCVITDKLLMLKHDSMKNLDMLATKAVEAAETNSTDDVISQIVSFHDKHFLFLCTLCIWNIFMNKGEHAEEAITSLLDFLTQHLDRINKIDDNKERLSLYLYIMLFICCEMETIEPGGVIEALKTINGIEDIKIEIVNIASVLCFQFQSRQTVEVINGIFSINKLKKKSILSFLSGGADDHTKKKFSNFLCAAGCDPGVNTFSTIPNELQDHVISRAFLTAKRKGALAVAYNLSKRTDLGAEARHRNLMRLALFYERYEIVSTISAENNYPNYELMVRASTVFKGGFFPDREEVLPEEGRLLNIVSSARSLPLCGDTGRLDPGAQLTQIMAEISQFDNPFFKQLALAYLFCGVRRSFPDAIDRQQEILFHVLECLSQTGFKDTDHYRVLDLIFSSSDEKQIIDIISAVSKRFDRIENPEDLGREYDCLASCLAYIQSPDVKYKVTQIIVNDIQERAASNDSIHYSMAYTYTAFGDTSTVQLHLSLIKEKYVQGFIFNDMISHLLLSERYDEAETWIDSLLDTISEWGWADLVDTLFLTCFDIACITMYTPKPEFFKTIMGILDSVNNNLVRDEIIPLLCIIAARCGEHRDSIVENFFPKMPDQNDKYEHYSYERHEIYLPFYYTLISGRNTNFTAIASQYSKTENSLKLRPAIELKLQYCIQYLIKNFEMEKAFSLLNIISEPWPVAACVWTIAENFNGIVIEHDSQYAERVFIRFLNHITNKNRRVTSAIGTAHLFAINGKFDLSMKCINIAIDSNVSHIDYGSFFKVAFAFKEKGAEQYFNEILSFSEMILDTSKKEQLAFHFVLHSLLGKTPIDVLASRMIGDSLSGSNNIPLNELLIVFADKTSAFLTGSLQTKAYIALADKVNVLKAPDEAIPIYSLLASHLASCNQFEIAAELIKNLAIILHSVNEDLLSFACYKVADQANLSGNEEYCRIAFDFVKNTSSNISDKNQRDGNLMYVLEKCSVAVSIEEIISMIHKIDEDSWGQTVFYLLSNFTYRQDYDIEAIFQLLVDDSDIAICHLNISNSFFKNGNEVKGSRHFITALDILKQITGNFPTMVYEDLLKDIATSHRFEHLFSLLQEFPIDKFDEDIMKELPEMIFDSIVKLDVTEEMIEVCQTTLATAISIYSSRNYADRITKPILKFAENLMKKLEKIEDCSLLLSCAKFILEIIEGHTNKEQNLSMKTALFSKLYFLMHGRTDLKSDFLPLLVSNGIVKESLDEFLVQHLDFSLAPIEFSVNVFGDKEATIELIKARISRPNQSVEAYVEILLQTVLNFYVRSEMKSATEILKHCEFLDRLFNSLFSNSLSEAIMRHHKI